MNYQQKYLKYKAKYLELKGGALRQSDWSNKAYVLTVVTQDGAALKYASPELQGDKEVVLAAVTQYGRALRYASPELQGDKEVVLAAVTQDGLALYYAPQALRADREVVLTAVARSKDALTFTSQELQREFNNKNKQELIELLNIEKQRRQAAEIRSFNQNPDIILWGAPLRTDWSNKTHVLYDVQEFGNKLEHASRELRADIEVVLAAVTNYGTALKYASHELRADIEVVLAAVSNDGIALKYASPELQGDKEVVLAAVTERGHALEFARELRADREVVLAAVTQEGRALEYASQELQGDKEVVLAAVTNNVYALEYASRKLLADREFVLAAVVQDGTALEFASPELQREFINTNKQELIQLLNIEKQRVNRQFINERVKQLEQIKQRNQRGEINPKLDIMKRRFNLYNNNQVPNEYICPITKDIMQDPVFISDGHTFERTSIATWFANNDTSPLTNVVLANKILIPNIALRNRIQDWSQGYSKDM
jgi:hypothetical protein